MYRQGEAEDFPLYTDQRKSPAGGKATGAINEKPEGEPGGMPGPRVRFMLSDVGGAVP